MFIAIPSASYNRKQTDWRHFELRVSFCSWVAQADTDHKLGPHLSFLKRRGRSLTMMLVCKLLPWFEQEMIQPPSGPIPPFTVLPCALEDFAVPPARRDFSHTLCGSVTFSYFSRSPCFLTRSLFLSSVSLEIITDICLSCFPHPSTQLSHTPPFLSFQLP